MGNDYCNGIRLHSGNNREQLLELFTVSDFNVDDFIELIYLMNKGKILYYIPENFLIKWELSRRIFTNIDILHPAYINIKYKKFNHTEIINFLQNFNIKNDIIKHFITSLENNYNIYNKTIIITPCLKLINNSNDSNNSNNSNNSNDSNDSNDWIQVSKKKL